MPKDLFNLIVNTPDGSASYYLLNTDVVRIGRGSENHIIVVEDPVSTKHCEVRMEGGQYCLADLGSKNGTHLNGSPVEAEPFALKNGDVILLGRTVRIQFGRVREINGTFSADAPGDGSTTTKLKRVPAKKKSAPATPSINPVAAAVARATRHLPKED